MDKSKIVPITIGRKRTKKKYFVIPERILNRVNIKDGDRYWVGVYDNKFIVGGYSENFDYALCSNCLNIKSIDNFQTHESGYVSTVCYQCYRANNNHYRTKHREKYPNRELGRSALSQAVSRKIIKKGPCAICGKKTHIEGHHPDYDKPYEIIWICRPHHRMIDNGIIELPPHAKIIILPRPIPTNQEIVHDLLKYYKPEPLCVKQINKLLPSYFKGKTTEILWQIRKKHKNIDIIRKEYNNKRVNHYFINDSKQ